MSTETTNVVSVPTAEDNQQHEKIVKEETHAVEQGDTPPSKNDAEKHEKENCEAQKSEGSETSITKSEETSVVNQVEPPVVAEVEKADHVPVQNVKADHQCQPIEAVEIEGEKPSVEAVENEEKVSVEAVENEEKIAVEAVEKELEKTQTIEAIENEEAEKAQTTEAVVENEPEKTEPIEDDKNKPVEEIAIEAVDKEADNTPVEKVAIEAVENEPEIQASEACEKKEKNIAIDAVEKESEILATAVCEDKAAEKIASEAVENEPETQATEACENKAVKKIAIEAVEKESEKTQAIEADENKQEETPAIEEQRDATPKIEADENKQEETPAIEEQRDATPKIEAFESNPSSEIVKLEENVQGEKGTTADEGKTTCELTTNKEAQTVEKEAGVVDNVKDETMQSEKVAEKEECVKVAQATKESDEKIEEASFENEAKKTEDGTNELKNATDQVIEKSVAGEQKSDRDLVEGLVKEDEYKDIKVNGEEEKNESKTDVPPTLESCKDGDHETQTSKDQAQDVSAKPAQKQSGNNIISKVKQSLVKVKKAIIGKSPSSKVLSPEIKGDHENAK
ncbi:hypothetical protein ABKV19_016173 [Rosa sericea]